MCEAPGASVVTTIRDTVSCSWIFYSNSAQSGAAGGGAEERGGAEAGGHSPSHPPTTPPDPTLDSMHMMLDPDLRPLTPDLSSPESVQIFQQHKQLAQEYLKVQTDLGYLMSYKAELLSQLADEELKEKKEIMELENERDSLTKVFRTLKKQSEMSGGAGSLQHDDAWTLITDTLPHE